MHEDVAFVLLMACLPLLALAALTKLSLVALLAAVACSALVAFVNVVAFLSQVCLLTYRFLSRRSASCQRKGERNRLQGVYFVLRRSICENG